MGSNGFPALKKPIHSTTLTDFRGRFLHIIEWELEDENYKSPISEKLRWRNWAADEEGITDTITCVLVASSLYMLGQFLPCIISFVLVVILLIIIYMFRKKRRGRTLVIKEEVNSSGYEGEDYYTPPPPSSKK